MSPNRRTPLSSAAIPPATSAAALARRALRLAQPSPLLVVSVTGVAIASAALSVGEPLIMRAAFDRISSRGADAYLAGCVALLVVLLAARGWTAAWLGGRTWDVRARLEFRLRGALSAKLARLPLERFANEGSGGLLYAIQEAVPVTVAAFAELAFKLLPAAAYLVLAVTAMARLNLGLMALVLLFAPVPAVVGVIASRAQRARARFLHHHWKGFWAWYVEIVNNVRTVRAFGREADEHQRFLEGQEQGFRLIREGAADDARDAAIAALGEVFARGTVLAVGGVLVARGHLSLGTLVAFLGYIGGLFGPVQNLTGMYQSVRKATVGLEAIFEVLDDPNEIHEREGATPAPALRGTLRFEDVTFAYHAGRQALSRVSFTVRPGEMVALVGASGSGKSTLLKLVQRLYEADRGRITIDGVDVLDMTADSLRRQIGVVPQDVELFNATVHENIAYGRPEATRAEVEAAARAAHAHDFITSLPRGYDALVGEGGRALSGGQRQRLALARAFLLDPPLLLLDEATSALDAETERAVQEGVRAVGRGRAMLVSAHRLATVIDADRILVVDGGVIVAEGTHEALLAACPRYVELVRHQLVGSEGAPVAPGLSAVAA